MKKKKVYRFKEGSWWFGASRGKAAKVGQQLERIAKTSGGLTARCVVEDARSKRSPLHPFFEWDDSAAAEKYRQRQARHLIQAVEVTYENVPGKPTAPFRAFVNLEHKSGQESPYRITVEVLSDIKLRGELLGQALAEAKSWQRRYERLDELADVFRALDDIPPPPKRKAG